MSVAVTLLDPNGNEWVAGSATEVHDLLAQGYTFKGQASVSADKPTPTPSPAPATPVDEGAGK